MIMKNLLIILLGFTLLILSSSCVTTARPTYANTKTVVVVKKAPTHRKVVYVKGHKYYTWGNKFYKKTRKGYVFVKL